MDILLKNNQSFLGKLNVRVRLAVGFAISILAVLAESLVLLSSLALLGAAIFFLGRPNRSQVRFVLLFAALLVWGLMFSQSIFYNQFPRDALVTIFEPNLLFREGLEIYVQGIHHGAIQSFRMLAVCLTGFAICFSTEADQFLRGLVAVKVPYSLSFMAVSAIQFAPVAVDELRQIRCAMRLKGYRPLARGARQTVRTEIGGLRAVLAGTIRRSEEKALSILTRGFDIDGTRTSLVDDKLSAKEWTGIAAIFFLVLGLGVAKTLFWLYQYQLFYSPALRSLYGFTREWL